MAERIWIFAVKAKRPLPPPQPQPTIIRYGTLFVELFGITTSPPYQTVGDYSVTSVDEVAVLDYDIGITATRNEHYDEIVVEQG